MKYVFLVFCLMSVQFVQSQINVFKISKTQLNLKIDSMASTDDYVVYKNNKPMRVLRLNSPLKITEGLDFYHRKISIVDSVNLYKCSVIDSVKINMIKLSLEVENKVLTIVSFAYKILGDGVRGDIVMTKKMTSSEASQKLKELMDSFKSGGLLLSSISFYDVSTMHTLSIGGVCLVK